MKSYFLIISIVFTSLVYSQTSGIPDYVPSDNLDGWWSFNGNSNDQSGNGNNGTVYGPNLTTDRFGNPDSAFVFDGIDDNIELLFPYFNGNTEVGEFTFSYWTNIYSIPVSNTHVVLKFSSYWREKLSGINSEGSFWFVSANPSPQIRLSSFTPENSANLTAWQNVVITYKNSNIKLYIDGVLTVSEDIPFSTLDFSQIITGDSNGKNLIGSDTSVSSGNFDFFHGKIDDIGAWQRALTECEIQDLFNAELNSGLGDSTVSITETSLSANQDGALYQWHDCNNGYASIEGETNQEFFPQTSGLYSVEVNLNGCIVYSECVPFSTLGLSNFQDDDIKIYPNPISEIFVIEIESKATTYQIYSIDGQIVKKGPLNQNKNIISINNLANGMYLLKLKTDDSQLIKRFIKK